MSTRLEQRTVAKTAAYTIVAPGQVPGTCFTNRGATGSVTFTLPPAGPGVKGWWYDFQVHADQSLIVAAATANTLVTIGDATADNVGFQVASKKVGRRLRTFCDGTAWFAYPNGAPDGFCIDGTEYAASLGAISTDAITGTDSSLGVNGQAAAQGGAIVLTGGASSTATNAGGAVSAVGGTGNTSGAGGAVNVTGGTGGATGIGGQVNITGGTPIAAAGGAVVIAGGAGVGTAKAGGLASVTGGASTGSATGGVASLVGGAASEATGAGGGVVITAANGNTTGAAGTVLVTAGQGGATNVAGGVATITGGIGNGTGVGGVASLVGGVGGTGGATGAGGAAKVTGGASVATNADGGGVIISGGAKNGGGFVGPIVLGNAQLIPIWYPQAAPATDAGDTSPTVTVAQMVAGLLSGTPTQARTFTLPTGAQMDAGVAFADVPATFGFDFSIQNRAAFAATDDIITVAQGASGMTMTGSAVISPGTTGRFRAVRTTTATWIIYKIAG